METTPAVRRGRPLDALLDGCILAATLQLLTEQGYDQVTVKDIADRAGAGLGAIYRRWPNKLALIVAALRAEDNDSPPPTPTGDTAEDLSRALIRTVERMERRTPGFVSAMQREPELAAAVRDALVYPKRREFAQILASAFDDPEERSLRAELALALPLQRLILGVALPDEDEIRTRLVPILLGRRPSPPANSVPPKMSEPSQPKSGAASAGPEEVGS